MNISTLSGLESEEYFTVRWGCYNWTSIDPELSLMEKEGKLGLEWKTEKYTKNGHKSKGN